MIKMSADVEVVKVHGHIFTAAKVRGFEVMCMEDGRVNLKSLCEMAGSKPFYNIISNQTFKDNVVVIEKSKVTADRYWKCEYSMGPGIPGPIEIEKLDFESIRNIVFHIEQGGKLGTKEARVAGTYGPRYLVDYLIMLENPAYLILVHELLEAIDKLSQVQNTTMESTIEDVTETLKAHVAELEEELKVKNVMIQTLGYSVAAKDKSNAQLLCHLHDCSNKKLKLKQRLTETENEKSSLELKLDATLIKLDTLQATNDKQTVMLQDANDKIDDMKQDVKSLIKTNLEVKEAVKSTNAKFKHQLDTFLPNAAITTATTKERLFVFYNKKTSYKIRKIIEAKHAADPTYPGIEADEVVLDVIRCQIDNLNKQMKEHNYNDSCIDIFNGDVNNAVDLFLYFGRYVPADVARCPAIQEKKRMIICKANSTRRLQQYLQSFATRNERIGSSLRDIIEINTNSIKDYIDEKIEDLDVKYKAEIEDVKTTVKTAVEEIKATIAELLEKHHPGCKQMQFNVRYRNIEEKNGKLYVRYGPKNSQRHYITEDDINNERFR